MKELVETKKSDKAVQIRYAPIIMSGLSDFIGEKKTELKLRV